MVQYRSLLLPTYCLSMHPSTSTLATFHLWNQKFKSYNVHTWAAACQNQQNDLRPNELKHDKTNIITCAPSEDSDQHPPSLIRIFTVRMKKPMVLGYPLSANSEDSDQTWQMPRMIWVFAGRTGYNLIMLVLSCFGSFSLQLNKFLWPWLLTYALQVQHHYHWL